MAVPRWAEVTLACDSEFQCHVSEPCLNDKAQCKCWAKAETLAKASKMEGAVPETHSQPE